MFKGRASIWVMSKPSLILKEVSTDDEEVVYQMVEDDVEFSALAKIFSELTDEETALEY